MALANHPNGGGSCIAGRAFNRPKFPEPKAYGGARDAKELENYLFDMEQYFEATNIGDDATKITTAAMYLSGDAKVWWRSQKADIRAGRLVINTWEELKQRVKRQFFPHNVEEQARRTLCALRQTGSIREYVQSFQACLLSITDMSEKDKLFFFKEGLKPWARQELQRARVEDLDTAIAQAESLVDYQSELRREPKPNGNNNNTPKSGATSLLSLVREKVGESGLLPQITTHLVGRPTDGKARTPHQVLCKSRGVSSARGHIVWLSVPRRSY